MKDSQIIKEIRKLQAIQPRKEWVLQTKTQILGEKQSLWEVFLSSFQFQPKMAYSFLAILILVGVAFFGFFNYPQNSVLTLKPNQVVAGPEYYLTLAEGKLDQIANNSQIDASQIQEATDIIKKAAESLPKQAKDPKKTAKIVEKVASINEKIGKVQKALGKEVAEKEVKALTTKTTQLLENSITRTQAELVRIQIEMLQKTSLNEKQQKLFQEAQKDYQDGRYQQALEKILKLTNK
jgi:hypothetical protein